MIAAPRRILVILHGSVGDVTRALPLANLIRRRYPEARLSWSVEPAAAPLVEHHPAVDDVILFDRSRWWVGLGPFLKRIRAGRFDLALDLQRLLKSGLISWWSRAPHRLGFHRRDAKECNWLFNNHHIPPVGNGISKLNHYLKFAQWLGIEPHPVEWRLSLLPHEESAVEEMLRDVGGGYAVFFVGSRWQSKKWFPADTARCAAALHKAYGLEVILLGGSDDIVFAEQARAFGLPQFRNWVGKTSLRQAVGILQRAQVAVGPDTGLMHLSAAVGTPVVSLWGATSPARTGPYGFADLVVQGRAACSPCYLRRCPIGRICMRSIAVEEVTAKVGAALSRKQKYDDARL